MDSIDFDGSNATFRANSINQKDMRAYIQKGIRLTCWRPTREELKMLEENKEVYLLEANGSIKLVTSNPLPVFLKQQNPIIFKPDLIKDETSTKENAQGA